LLHQHPKLDVHFTIYLPYTLQLRSAVSCQCHLTFHVTGAHVSCLLPLCCSSFKTQCPVTFLLSAKQDGSDQFLTVTAQVMHHNHETDAESYKLHQSVRRLDANKHQTQEDLVCDS